MIKRKKKINVSDMTEREMDIWQDGRDNGLGAASNLFVSAMLRALDMAKLTAHDKEVIQRFLRDDKK
jgi:hypothetical protein